MTTSSTTTQRSSGPSGGPSMRRCSPCALASLRTKKAFAARPAGKRGARDRVGAHRHAPHRGGSPLGDLGSEQLAERGEAVGAQDGALGVHVVLGARAARERHLADHQRVLAQLLHETLARAPRARSYDSARVSMGGSNLAMCIVLDRCDCFGWLRCVDLPDRGRVVCDLRRRSDERRIEPPAGRTRRSEHPRTATGKARASPQAPPERRAACTKRSTKPPNSLTSPFSAITAGSSSEWAIHGVRPAARPGRLRLWPRLSRARAPGATLIWAAAPSGRAHSGTGVAADPLAAAAALVVDVNRRARRTQPKIAAASGIGTRRQPWLAA